MPRPQAGAEPLPVAVLLPVVELLPVVVELLPLVVVLPRAHPLALPQVRGGLLLAQRSARRNR